MKAQEIRKEYGPFKGAHYNIDFKLTTFRDFVKKTSRFSWSPTAIYNRDKKVAEGSSCALKIVALLLVKAF